MVPDIIIISIFTVVKKFLHAMKKITLLSCALMLSASIMAQEVSEYQTVGNDDIQYLQDYNAEPYSQTPVRESIRQSKNRQARAEVDMGMGFSKAGSTEYISPRMTFQPGKRWQVTAGMGMAISNFKAPVFTSYSETPDYQNLRAISNYYNAEVAYMASERLLVTGSIIYGQSRFVGQHKYSSTDDGYICTFGATYQITPGLSIGFEVSRAQNMYPVYGGYGYPYHRF